MMYYVLIAVCSYAMCNGHYFDKIGNFRSYQDCIDEQKVIQENVPTHNFKCLKIEETK